MEQFFPNIANTPEVVAAKAALLTKLHRRYKRRANYWERQAEILGANEQSDVVHHMEIMREQAFVCLHAQPEYVDVCLVAAEGNNQWKQLSTLFYSHDELAPEQGIAVEPIRAKIVTGITKKLDIGHQRTLWEQAFREEKMNMMRTLRYINEGTLPELTEEDVTQDIQLLERRYRSRMRKIARDAGE